MPSLLERDAELTAFDDALADASRGAGRVLLLHGEAGIGKTTVVQAMIRRAGGRARTLIGGCDDLLTPRTLGPFQDMALGSDSPLRRALATRTDRDAVLSAVIEELANPLHPTVVVVEDAHWADEATRDVLGFLGRRIDQLPAVLVVTYRDDADLVDHLHTMLGGLTGPHTRRLALRPLSRDALSALAVDRAVSADHLLTLTGGNPFLVTEFLAAPDGAVPLSVRDAVVARMHTLAGSDARLLEVLAATPGGLELSLLRDLFDSALEGLATLERLGLVEVDGTHARFRHELLRRAAEAACSSAQRVAAHSRILVELERRGGDPFRAVHHAIGAGDDRAIARHAPAAARRASEVASHRDAIFLFEQALRHGDDRPVLEQARLLRWYAFELYLANRHRDAAQAANQAVTRLAGVDAPEDLGKSLTILSHVSCWAVQPKVALEAAERSVALLSTLPPSEALGVAYANQSFVTAMRGRFAASAEAARQGIEVVERLDLTRVRPYVTAQLGAATYLDGDPAGESLLTAAVEQAQQVGAHEFVPLACTWLCIGALRHGRPDAVESWATSGLAYSEEHQLEVGQTTLRMHLHDLELRRGNWAAAEAGLSAIVRDPDATGWGHSVACTLLGRLHARRGEPDALELLSRGWRLAVQSEEVERLGRAGIGWFEWAALHDDDQARGRGEEALAVVQSVGNPWLLGELVRWRAIADDTVDDTPGTAEPWASGARGAWQEAAEAFARLRWPFERAQELAASDRPELMVESLRILEGLGATTSAAMLRRVLRARGVTNLPRGPIRDTRENPLGLTARQLEVLGLLAAGLTNAQIAERLVLSVRTVDHHVSAVLNKLGVASRQEAVEEAARLGVPVTA